MIAAMTAALILALLWLLSARSVAIDKRLSTSAPRPVTVDRPRQTALVSRRAIEESRARHTRALVDRGTGGVAERSQLRGRAHARQAFRPHGRAVGNFQRDHVTRASAEPLQTLGSGQAR